MTNKKKLVYLSPECFSDVDFQILDQLNLEYNLYWIVIFHDLSISYKPKSSPEDVLNYARNNNIKVDIRERKGRIRSLNNVIFNINILKKVRSLNPDVIYIESFVDFYFSLISIFLLPVNKCVIGVHDVIPHVGELNFLKKISNWIQRIAFKNFHLFSKTQLDIFRIKYPAKRTFLAQLSLKSIEGFENRANEMIKKENDLTIFIFFGVIRYSKGLDYLLQASEILIQQGIKNFKVIIKGKCHNWKYYQQYIEHKEFFEYTNNLIPNERIPDLLCSGHFLVLPYRDVTQSGPLFFAYNYNLPIIASNLAGFKEYITHDTNGLLFRSDDVHSLAQEMQYAIDMNDCHYQQIKLAQINFKKENLSKEKVVMGYKNMIDSI